MMKGLKLAFGAPFPSPPSLVGKGGIPSLVKRQSRGNVLLQMGRYATREQLDDRKERVLRSVARSKASQN